MTQWVKIRNSLKWLPAYLRQRLGRTRHGGSPGHLIIALADHFEPSILPGTERHADLAEQECRLERWCREYPKKLNPWRDDDGRPFRHTYFYPSEQYNPVLIDRLAEHCRAGWGEIEVQLHHGLHAPDTGESVRQQLLEFRGTLVTHGCLSRWEGVGPPRYAFMHGNWALANSANGHFCGVDNEIQILEETGCYADFTLPSAPNCAQVGKINALYECALPLDRRAAHRRGRDLRRDHPPKVFPLMVQGPLMIAFRHGKGNWLPVRIENSALSMANPPTMPRLQLWRQAAIGVKGQPDWIFIKLHCHGMDPRDADAMLGASLQRFLGDLTDGPSQSRDYAVHFVTAREMVNMILAACDGREGNPYDYKDYRLRLITEPREP